MIKQDEQEYHSIIVSNQEESFATWLKSALSDGTNPSTSRLLVMLCVPVSVLLPLFTWMIMSIASKKLLEFPASTTGFVMSTTTLLLSVLHLNKREETKENIALSKHAEAQDTHS